MRTRIVVGAALAGVSWAAYVAVRQWWKSWGVDPAEAARPMAGDDLIPEAQTSDTRGITIDAPVESVWPWLVQMGYGRGGWYSIDQLDMRGRSADRIVPEWQALAAGEVMPTHPGGGFEVKVLEPGRALVLYADSTTMQPPDEAGSEPVPAGLAASGAFLSATPGQVRASWAFVLEPIGANRTRLLERVRYWGAKGSTVSNAALSVLGFGVFVMMQRQMVGIRTRAERLAIEEALPPVPGALTSATNGHHAGADEELVAVAART